MSIKYFIITLLSIPSDFTLHNFAQQQYSTLLNSQGQLRKKLGQLQYLENLGKTDYGKRGGSNPEPCPICTRYYSPLIGQYS